MSWFVDPEDLIIEVESRPLLYAKSLPEYASKFLKNDAWEDVAQNLSEDWDTLNNEEKQSRCKYIVYLIFNSMSNKYLLILLFCLLST